MPLYLDEIWLKWPNVERAKQALEQFRSMATKDFPYPEGVSLRAGPWFSNEEAKLVLVLDIPDHSKTFGAFGMGIAHGMIERRRLTPIVEWSEVDKLIALL
jgi:hypothetical protein